MIEVEKLLQEKGIKYRLIDFFGKVVAYSKYGIKVFTKNLNKIINFETVDIIQE